ncbi:MAG: response regulator [Eubacterium sp.]|nr:response regulator [Eubacterium sp.]MCI8918791.1 response regulator [Eubacterium sp.]
MGNQFIWQDRFNIGVEVIDREHRKLFSIMNRLMKFREQEDKSQWVCQEGVKYFKDHAMKHFAEEEVYMASIDYKGFETHRRLHDNFRQKTLPALEEELNRTNYSEDAISHFLGVCAGWLIGHTLTEDRAITGKAMSKWADLMPQEDQVAVKQTIIRLVYDLFNLNARIVSESYGGEKFGKGIYYRLVYGSNKGDRMEVYFVFEERLLINTVGKIMGASSDKLNVMLMNATRYTARQFADCVKGNFQTEAMYEVQEENLLSYEQFQRIFERQKLQFSILFDTGEGYFAHCVVAPHLVQNNQDTETPIKTENAMAEVKKYLKGSEESRKNQKRKILVVDDSDVFRQAMKELLGSDYEVALAKSGVSAIRSLTLDRPDLVLLDYEMPVCDGYQVLGMIRSEESIADIPVIFMSGRVDKERVDKILALKPAGYLLKTLKPAEIKHSIDQFFNRKHTA